jgi:hypothetical protein
MAAYGGMERHVCVLAKEAARRGHHIKLLTTSNSLNQTTRADLAAAGIVLHELPRQRDNAGPLLKLAWLWRETLAARFTRWDIIYTNGQSALASVVWHAGRRKTRIIHHHHTAADAGEQATWAPRFGKYSNARPRSSPAATLPEPTSSRQSDAKARAFCPTSAPAR